jgi:UDP:flavonoid glycosyltransferase YjiC (YdhE family)
LPKPADWGEAIHVTGYWFLPPATDWSPPPALVDFLHAGPPPVYIGFGRMVSRQPEETADLVIQAVTQSGQRAILLTGWGGLQKERLPENICLIDSAPHDWLFSQVAAVVHHGGAGTTAAGIRAGVPSLIIPFFGDQFFWGTRVAALGIGPAPIPRKQLTVDRLAAALQTMTTNQPMQQRAAQLGAQVQAEDGVAQAVAIIAAMGR